MGSTEVSSEAAYILTADVGIDDQERLSFLTSLADKVNKPDSQDAYVYALADVANVKQRLQDFDGAKKDLEMCQRVLDSFDAVETVVHASFYKVNADYYHVSTHSSLLATTAAD